MLKLGIEHAQRLWRAVSANHPPRFYTGLTVFEEAGNVAEGTGHLKKEIQFCSTLPHVYLGLGQGCIAK